MTSHLVVPPHKVLEYLGTPKTYPFQNLSFFFFFLARNSKPQRKNCVAGRSTLYGGPNGARVL
jgi:hypothetical protein